MKNKKIIILATCILVLLTAFAIRNTHNSVEFTQGNERELIPLGFYVSNMDEVNHTVKVDIFDSGKMIYSETYDLTPHSYTGKLGISNDNVTYLFEATLDSNVTETYEFSLGYYEGPVDITISNETGSEATIHFGYQIE